MRKRKRRKRKFIRIEKFKKGKKIRVRLIVRGKPILGLNSHELPRAKRRGDRRPIRHIHIYGSKRHIPLDLKYVGYVLSDFGRSVKRKFRKKKKGNRKED